VAQAVFAATYLGHVSEKREKHCPIQNNIETIKTYLYTA